MLYFFGQLYYIWKIKAAEVFLPLLSALLQGTLAAVDNFFPARYNREKFSPDFVCRARIFHAQALL